MRITRQKQHAGEKTRITMAFQSDKEEQQFRNRLRDLANKSYQQNIYTFSAFLGLSEISVYEQMKKEISFAHPMLYGGYEMAERQMVRFGSPEEFGYEEEFPITCIHVTPLLAKFADELSHRDFLGALMNLGMERSCIGDIRTGEKEGYIFCIRSMADFICENLLQIKHTHVKCEKTDLTVNFSFEEPGEQEVLVSSLRLDGCISRLCSLSRNESLQMFAAGRVFVNGRLTENNSRLLAVGDVVNVRGFGKFIFAEEKYTTKKGKLCLKFETFT